MVKNAGKNFERKFSQALHELPGLSMRIEDGGRYGLNKQWGDFFYFSPSGQVFLFECKATATKNFPNKNLSYHQFFALKNFSLLAENFSSVLAINFYNRNVLVLIEISLYENFLNDSKRKSLPIYTALDIGREISITKNEKGFRIWELSSVVG